MLFLYENNSYNVFVLFFFCSCEHLNISTTNLQYFNVVEYLSTNIVPFENKLKGKNELATIMLTHM